MKFSTKSRYALRLMAELARYAPGTTVSLKEISERQNLSLKYLEQIVTPLARVGLVKSERGSQGGYRLSRPAAQITAGDILRAVEGEIVPVPCLATSAESCPHRAQCETLGFWEGLNQVINQYIDSATLEKLSSEYLSH
jgi:Rrf2 family cysteine metabolism transcriptional repressor